MNWKLKPELRKPPPKTNVEAKYECDGEGKGEDEHKDGSVHPRENVIHEAGLFQGRLGFPRAIVLLEPVEETRRCN